LRCFIETERAAFDDILKKQKEDVLRREEELKVRNDKIKYNKNIHE